MTKNTLTCIQKHNGIISFWKFCFCIMIVLFHGRVFAVNENNALFSKGSISVEFFFLVSGYLLGKAALKPSLNETTKNLEIETFRFIWKKFINFLPYVLFGGIISLILQNIYKHIGLYNSISSIWDLLLLRMTGLKTKVIIGQVWYISAMLLSMMILYPLIRKYKYNFIYIVCPIIVLFGFGWLNHSYSNLREPELWLGFTYKGVVRAFLELTLGCILYVICMKLKNIKFTKFGKILITIIEIGGFILPFIVSQFIHNAKADFILVAVLSVSIVLAFSEKTLEFNIFNNKFFYWLESFSLPLYICHIAVRDYVQYSSLFVNMTYKYKLAIYLLITFVLSLICMYLIKFLKNKNFYIEKIKGLIISENYN